MRDTELKSIKQQIKMSKERMRADAAKDTRLTIYFTIAIVIIFAVWIVLVW
jgi:hypothetical protein